nr:MAG: putative RNA-dependent RNA polymerase [Botourmiaviridae sp.]
MVTTILEHRFTSAGEITFCVASSVTTRLQRRHYNQCVGSCTSANGPAIPRSSGQDAKKREIPSNCANSGWNKKRVKKAQKLLRHEFALPPSSPLAPLIECGQLRSALRATYAGNLPPCVELSIKSVSKLERSPCSYCKLGTADKLADYKEARFQPVQVDALHLQSFERAVAGNIPEGWNLNPGPYIPNGHACLGHGRTSGGNWNEGVFSNACSACMVMSSGKPRIVTLYSSRNTEVLTPLHDALYAKLGRKGWLLVGEPTPARIKSLNGSGPFVSIDYQSATDNIKARYTRVVVEQLILKADGLTDEEVRAMRVLGELRFEEDGPAAERGQPMGSVMSFPILCLINKAVVDLSLTDLLLSGKIGFKEWTRHRCLINGDDLLTREPLPSGGELYDAIVRNGQEVGLVVNESKTMTSTTLAEINSTLFELHSGQDITCNKKCNLGALAMRGKVKNVVGEAYAATRTCEGFIFVLKQNLRALSCSSEYSYIPKRYRKSIMRHTKTCVAFREAPIGSPGSTSNPFPVTIRSPDYGLTRQEENQVIKDHVRHLRSVGYRPKTVPDHWLGVRYRAWSAATRVKSLAAPKERTLLILQKAWLEKVWEMVVESSREAIERDLALAKYEVEVEDLSFYESRADPSRWHLINRELKPYRANKRKNAEKSSASWTARFIALGD